MLMVMKEQEKPSLPFPGTFPRNHTPLSMCAWPLGKLCATFSESGTKRWKSGTILANAKANNMISFQPKATKATLEQIGTDRQVGYNALLSTENLLWFQSEDKENEEK